MNDVQQLVADLTSLFGVVMVLAVTITGFFLGRKWLDAVGESGGKAKGPVEPVDWYIDREDQSRYRVEMSDGSVRYEAVDLDMPQDIYNEQMDYAEKAWARRGIKK